MITVSSFYYKLPFEKEFSTIRHLGNSVSVGELRNLIYKHDTTKKANKSTLTKLEATKTPEEEALKAAKMDFLEIYLDGEMMVNDDVRIDKESEVLIKRIKPREAKMYHFDDDLNLLSAPACLVNFYEKHNICILPFEKISQKISSPRFFIIRYHDAVFFEKALVSKKIELPKSLFKNHSVYNDSKAIFLFSRHGSGEFQGYGYIDRVNRTEEWCHIDWLRINRVNMSRIPELKTLNLKKIHFVEVPKNLGEVLLQQFEIKGEWYLPRVHSDLLVVDEKIQENFGDQTEFNSKSTKSTAGYEPILFDFQNSFIKISDDGSSESVTEKNPSEVGSVTEKILSELSSSPRAERRLPPQRKPSPAPPEVPYFNRIVPQYGALFSYKGYSPVFPHAQPYQMPPPQNYMGYGIQNNVQNRFQERGRVFKNKSSKRGENFRERSRSREGSVFQKME